jgi:hypothetical protein
MVRMRTIYPPRGERWRFPEPLVCKIEERFGDCLDTDHARPPAPVDGPGAEGAEHREGSSVTVAGEAVGS